MIEEEEIEEDRNINNQKSKGPVIYPKVYK